MRPAPSGSWRPQRGRFDRRLAVLRKLSADVNASALCVAEIRGELFGGVDVKGVEDDPTRVVTVVGTSMVFEVVVAVCGHDVEPVRLSAA